MPQPKRTVHGCHPPPERHARIGYCPCIWRDHVCASIFGAIIHDEPDREWLLECKRAADAGMI